MSKRQLILQFFSFKKKQKMGKKRSVAPVEQVFFLGLDDIYVFMLQQYNLNSIQNLQIKWELSIKLFN